MFISRKTWEETLERIKTLETYTRKDFDKLESHGRDIKKLKETVGEESPSIYDSYMLRQLMRPFGGYYEEYEPKKLTLVQKVEQIIELSGFQVKRTHASVELAKKPVAAKKATKTTKKAKK